MRKLFRGAAALPALLLLAAPACKHHEVPVAETIEEAPRLASAVEMNDPVTAKQLAGGFYEVESSAWRWTAKKFTVNLRPPAHAAQNGAALELHFTIPQPSFAKLGALTLSASVGGASLPPETYSKSGDFVYRREIPASVLAGDSVRVDFELDKAIPPGGADKRELGVVAASVALVAK
jgi:hypothetical protein